MKGFKIVAENMFHKGFKYQEGLNVDPHSFRPEGSCVAGGLYFFTDIKDVVNWLDFGVYLYEVEVPNGRRYVKDPSGNKYRSKYLILKNRFDLRDVSTWKYIIQLGVDIHANNDYALGWAAEKGHLEVVKFLVENGVDIHADNDEALCWSAANGFLEVVRFLVENGADIHVRDGIALRYAARNGYLDLVKYLVENGADIHARDEYALRWAAYYGHTEVVEYFKSVGAVYEGI